MKLFKFLLAFFGACFAAFLAMWVMGEVGYGQTARFKKDTTYTPNIKAPLESAGNVRIHGRTIVDSISVVKGNDTSWIYMDGNGNLVLKDSSGTYSLDSLAAGGGSGGSGASNVAYDATSWNGVTDSSATKNALRDKFVAVDATTQIVLDTTVTHRTNITTILNAANLVADTTALKALTSAAPGEYRYLKELAVGAGVGAGSFVIADSAYPEGVIAFGCATAGKQWVREEFLQTKEVNVQWAGAYNDSTNPNATVVAINKAIHVAYQVKSSTYFPAGTYLWNSAGLPPGAGLIGRPGMYLHGDPNRKTIIRRDVADSNNGIGALLAAYSGNGGVSANVADNNYTIRDLTFIGSLNGIYSGLEAGGLNPPNPPAWGYFAEAGIAIVGDSVRVNRVVIENVEIRGVQREAFQIWDADYAFIHGNRSIANNYHAYNTSRIKDLIFTNNFADSCYLGNELDGMLRYSPTDSFSRTLVANNIFRNSLGYGLAINGNNGDMLIVNNEFSAAPDSFALDYLESYGILIRQSTGGVVQRKLGSITIQSNILRGHAIGIAITGVDAFDSPIDQLAVIGNRITETQQQAMFLQASDSVKVKHVVIRDNLVSNWNRTNAVGSPDQAGIIIWNVDSILVEGNSVFNTLIPQPAMPDPMYLTLSRDAVVRNNDFRSMSGNRLIWQNDNCVDLTIQHNLGVSGIYHTPSNVLTNQTSAFIFTDAIEDSGRVIFQSPEGGIATDANLLWATSGALPGFNISSLKNLTDAPSSGGLRVTDTRAVQLGVGGLITFSGSYTGTTNTTAGAIHAYKENATNGEFGFSLAFNTRQNGGSNAERMRLTSTSRLGVNNIDPDSTITATGGIHATGGALIGGGLTVTGATDLSTTTSDSLHVTGNTRFAGNGTPGTDKIPKGINNLGDWIWQPDTVGGGGGGSGDTTFTWKVGSTGVAKTDSMIFDTTSTVSPIAEDTSNHVALHVDSTSWVATDYGLSLKLDKTFFDLLDPGATNIYPFWDDVGNEVDWASAGTIKSGLSLENVTNESKATMFTGPTFTGTVTIPTPFTIGTISMSSTGTQLNYLNSATGTTGTTNSNLVFSASPTFTGTVSGVTSAHVGLGDVENVALSSITFTAGNGVQGGGTLAANRTFDISPKATGGLVVTGDSLAVDSTKFPATDYDVSLKLNAAALDTSTVVHWPDTTSTIATAYDMSQKLNLTAAAISQVDSPEVLIQRRVSGVGGATQDTLIGLGMVDSANALTGTTRILNTTGTGTSGQQPTKQSDGTVTWAAAGGNAPTFRIELATPVLAALVWTNQPAALSFWLSTATVGKSITKANLTDYTQVRLLVNKQGTAGGASSKIILRYLTTFTQTASSWLDIGTSEVSVATNNTNTFTATSWINLPAGAKADVFISLLGSGGDGVLDPAFGMIVAEFK